MGPLIDRARHPAVIGFSASWCGPRHQQQPDLDALARCYRPYGAISIGVDIRDDRANASAYGREFRVPYPSIFDPSSDLASGSTSPPHRPPC